MRTLREERFAPLPPQNSGMLEFLMRHALGSLANLGRGRVRRHVGPEGEGALLVPDRHGEGVIRVLEFRRHQRGSFVVEHAFRRVLVRRGRVMQGLLRPADDHVHMAGFLAHQTVEYGGEILPAGLAHAHGQGGIAVGRFLLHRVGEGHELVHRADRR